jgi:hypothetical protein
MMSSLAGCPQCPGPLSGILSPEPQRERLLAAATEADLAGQMSPSRKSSRLLSGLRVLSCL